MLTTLSVMKFGRVELVPLPILEVDWGVDWCEAVRRSGRNCHPDLNIHEQGYQFVADRVGVTPMQGSIIRFPDGWRREQALGWLYEHDLPAGHPRQAMAVGEQLPHLHRLLEVKYMAVVSLMECELDIRGSKVRFVTQTWIADDWSESRLWPAAYIWPGFSWFLADGLPNERR